MVMNRIGNNDERTKGHTKKERTENEEGDKGEIRRNDFSLVVRAHVSSFLR